MTKFDELRTALEAEYVRYHDVHATIARFTLQAIAALVEERVPDAAYVEVDVTDQDYSGGLTFDGLLDANADPIVGEAVDAIWDDMVDVLPNLDDSNRDNWVSFQITDADGRNARLDLFAIRRDLP